MGTSTPVRGLYKPAVNEVGWAAAVDANFDNLDATADKSYVDAQVLSNAGISTLVDGSPSQSTDDAVIIRKVSGVPTVLKSVMGQLSEPGLVPPNGGDGTPTILDIEVNPNLSYAAEFHSIGNPGTEFGWIAPQPDGKFEIGAVGSTGHYQWITFDPYNSPSIRLNPTGPLGTVAFGPVVGNIVITTLAAGTVSSTNSSPLLSFQANYWNGSASASDQWTISSSLAAGTNGASTLTIAHIGSTGTARLASAQGMLLYGNGLSVGPGTTTPQAGVSQILLYDAGNALKFQMFGTAGLRMSSDVILSWASSTTVSGAGDTALTRLGAASIGLGNGTAGNTSGTLTLATVILAGSSGGVQTVSNNTGGGAIQIGGRINAVTTNPEVTLGGLFSTAPTTGTMYEASATTTFAPASGTAGLVGLISNPVINQTGGANGTVRVLAAYPVNTALVGTEYLLALGTSSAVGPAGTLTDKLLVDNTGTIKTYAGETTAGVGAAYLRGSTSQKAEVGADASVLSVTPGAVAGSYRLRVVISVSAATAATIGWTATWTDSNGNAQTPTNLALFQTGAAAPALTFTTSAAGNYHGEADIDINNAGTAIVIKTTFSGTSVAYKISATIERII